VAAAADLITVVATYIVLYYYYYNNNNYFYYYCCHSYFCYNRTPRLPTTPCHHHRRDNLEKTSRRRVLRPFNGRRRPLSNGIFHSTEYCAVRCAYRGGCSVVQRVSGRGSSRT